MNKPKTEAAKPASFKPSNLTKDQQEAVVEHYLGYHPRYFLYDGQSIKINLGRFEADERSKGNKNPKYNRRWFNGWNPKPNPMRVKNAKERENRVL